MSEISGQRTVPQGSVLVVDDDPDVREGLCEFLVNEGYTVNSACNGVEALAQLRDCPSDVVLLDLRMPGMDGYEFLRLREAEVTLRNIPVVVVSATSDEREISFSGVSTLQKPVKIGLLLELIHSEMSKRYVH